MSRTELNKTSHRREALSGQVAAVIRSRIADGVYTVGSVLPPRPLLADELGVSRSTLDLACRALRNEGLLAVVPGRGRGTVVIDPLKPPGREVLARRGAGEYEKWPGRGATRDTVERITAAIRKRIADGTYRPGGRIPTVTELAMEFGARTWLAREAVDSLREEGVVYCRRPAGHFVRPGAAARADGSMPTTRQSGGSA
ncbi:winged helix-turn-helix domain-containing protein [Streptomyces sp. NPDC058417]|uniref:winged helix-turn-helix domain-containing protein n=1 Tax=unclassified Streptomyces TaxID=2593676 RepID=UPI003651B66A